MMLIDDIRVNDYSDDELMFKEDNETLDFKENNLKNRKS